MKKYILGAALLFSFNLSAKTFTTPDVGVTFELPNNYTELDDFEIALKFPQKSKNPPKFVVGDERRTISVAYGNNDWPITSKNLPFALKHLHSGLSTAKPDLHWVEHKLITLNDKQWIYLEFISKAIDTDIHNIMMVAPHKGKTVVFNFNATTEKFKQNEAELRQAITSIRLP
jgi:hypothetical protein